ncbi:5'-methylthioadenosine/adenosylhomocysteine nucleosidase [Noviherbaspirillum massiliense]|uniref:5'-methylthioadenosine/adenosylhomocysteine nucleosidase n=1 Tax=Noviherbaspirillum massiliense TaxID=1465823 RepID=UPI0002E5C799|nr:5'-methylthioadenosine/adenosylhomocysteine nucleosidase [Noviherbaspirillum massiliense]
MTSSIPKLGLISAMDQEQAGLVDLLQEARRTVRGQREFISGRLEQLECVCVLSRLGKVAAAATAATLIEGFGVTHIVFTGVAGSADPSVRIGDMVVADRLIQHDMNASPLFPRFEVPLTGQASFAADRPLSDRLMGEADSFLRNELRQALAEEDLRAFRLDQPRVHRGLIASGDEFIHSRDRLDALKTSLPDVLAVEMEGAALAQVCFEFGVPFAVIRTISDNADHEAPLNFLQFMDRVAARYAFHVMQRFCRGG